MLCRCSGKCTMWKFPCAVVNHVVTDSWRSKSRSLSLFELEIQERILADKRMPFARFNPWMDKSSMVGVCRCIKPMSNRSHCSSLTFLFSRLIDRCLAAVAVVSRVSEIESTTDRNIRVNDGSFFSSSVLYLVCTYLLFVCVCEHMVVLTAEENVAC